MEEKKFEQRIVNKGKPTIIKTITAVVSRIDNVIAFSTQLLDGYDKKGALIWHDDAIPESEIWVKVGGDHGKGSFKVALQVCNLNNVNSKQNTHLLYKVDVKDTVNNLSYNGNIHCNHQLLYYISIISCPNIRTFVSSFDCKITSLLAICSLYIMQNWYTFFAYSIWLGTLLIFFHINIKDKDYWLSIFSTQDRLFLKSFSRLVCDRLPHVLHKALTFVKYTRWECSMIQMISFQNEEALFFYSKRSIAIKTTQVIYSITIAMYWHIVTSSPV